MGSRLPDAATIAPEKLRDYVLSSTHPVGRFKAAFFATLGYTQADWARLATDLRAQCIALDATPLETTRFGTKYRIEGPLTGPSGRTAIIVSIWIIPAGERTARLVTLFPGGP